MMDTKAQHDFSMPIILSAFLLPEAFITPWKSLWRPITFECLYDSKKHSTQCGHALAGQFDYGAMVFALAVLASTVLIVSYFVFGNRLLYRLFLSCQSIVFLLAIVEFFYIVSAGGLSPLGDG